MADLGRFGRKWPILALLGAEVCRIALNAHTTRYNMNLRGRHSL